jgi:hypothetical protein
MVKQGRYAKSSKMKQIKAIRKRMHAPAGRVIQPDAFDQFVLVRYGLTLKKRLKGIAKETVQRFLQEMLVVTSVDEAWSLETILVKTFKNINIKVPFQFYRVMMANWPEVQHFLQREIPAVPLKHRIIVTNPVNADQLQTIILNQLAANTLIETLGGNPDMMKTITSKQVEQLTAGLVTNDVIDWNKVSTIFQPIGFDVDSAEDAGTKQWFEQLMSE